MTYFETGIHHAHSILRWAVIIAGIISIYRAYTGMTGKRNWDSGDNKAGMWFVLFCHLQLLIGLIMYFYYGHQNAFENMKESMKDAETRYWSIEHFFGMFIAVALIQVGRILSKKAATDLLKHRKALIWYSIGMILILVNIPWPWKTIGRSIFPGL